MHPIRICGTHITMGQDTDGILAYGYDLGGAEEGWQIREVADDQLQLDWYHPDDEFYDFASQAERQLLAAAGGDSEQIKVEFATYCSHDYPMYLIATKTIEVARGHIEHLNLHALANAELINDWDEDLVVALRILGITPIQPQPGWMLCSYWG